MKKVTLFLSLLILVSSLTSCFSDNTNADDYAVRVAVWSIFGKVTQQMPDAAAPEVFKFDEDFNVALNGSDLFIESSFVNGGFLKLKASKSEENSNWIITSVNIAPTNKIASRFEIDPTDPSSITVFKIDPVSKAVDLNFELILQDRLEQKSVPMIVDFTGTLSN